MSSFLLFALLLPALCGGDVIVRTYAGSGSAACIDGPGLNGAAFKGVRGLALLTDGRLIVADTGNSRVRLVEAEADRYVRTLAGDGSHGHADGAGTAASFFIPSGVSAWSSPQDPFFVNDEENAHIRAVGLNGDVSTLSLNWARIPGPTPHQLYQQRGLVAHGNVLFVADTMNSRIVSLSPIPGEAFTNWTAICIAGAKGPPGYADGTQYAAKFDTPSAVAHDVSDSILYVSDTDNNAIRAIRLGDNTVTTLAGGSGAGFTDGVGTSARFNSPFGLAVMPDGLSLLVVEQGNNAVRRVIIRGPEIGRVTTVAGNGTRGFANGVGSAALFNQPQGIVINRNGLAFVSDYSNRIRTLEFTPDPVKPREKKSLPPYIVAFIAIAVTLSLLLLCTCGVLVLLARRSGVMSAVDLAESLLRSRSTSTVDEFDVMLSFRSTDANDAAIALHGELTRRGFSVYCSAVSNPPGLLWPDLVQHGVRASRSMVCLVSPGYGASLWTKRELHLADHLAKPLIPLWHSGSWPSEATAVFLSGIQHLPRERLDPGLPFGGLSIEKVTDELEVALAEHGVTASVEGGWPEGAEGVEAPLLTGGGEGRADNVDN